MAVYQTPLVDDRTGDISCHGRAGLTLEVEFRDAAGQPRNVSAAPLFFEIAGVLRVALIAGSTTAHRTIQLTQAQVASAAGLPRQFALRDESGAVPDVVWRGRFEVTGFTEQPA